MLEVIPAALPTPRTNIITKNMTANSYRIKINQVIGLKFFFFFLLWFNSYLRREAEFCNGIWIRDESESSTSLDHRPHVVFAKFMSEIAQNPEYRQASYRTGYSVQCGNDQNVPSKLKIFIKSSACSLQILNPPVNVVLEVVVWGVGDYCPEANWQREEALGNSCVPYLWI